MGIKSWIDTDGTRHFADEDSKAYRKRSERGPEPETGGEAFIPIEKRPRGGKAAEEPTV